MCTAVTYQSRDHYFGRNLDLEYSYRETITIVPRNFPLRFRETDNLPHHLAFFGVAHLSDGVPLFYDAMNEAGLAAAALRLPQSTVYHPALPGKHNIASFELIPWLLGQCETLREARQLLADTNLTPENFSPTLPCTPLHWLVADRSSALVVESLADGLHVHDDPFGVLTNEPPFILQRKNLHCEKPVKLPGDFSSISRYIKAAYVKKNAVSDETETAVVHQIFHILGSVAMPRGSVRTTAGEQHTVYTSCCNLDRAVYYYTAYENSTIHAVELYREDLDRPELITYPLIQKGSFHLQNL